MNRNNNLNNLYLVKIDINDEVEEESEVESESEAETAALINQYQEQSSNRL